MFHADHHPLRWLCGMVLAAAVVLPAALGPSSVGATTAVAQAEDNRCSDPTITANGRMAVLDPGHHSGDPGAANGTYNLHEAALNLDIAERARRALNDLGYRVCLTRTEQWDEQMGNSDRGDYANAVTQGYALEKTVFLSIHLNATTTRPEKTNYTKTFWGKKNKDLAFSKAIHDALWDELKYDGYGALTNLTDGGVGQFATGSLLHAKMAGTLAENVFLSNNEEAARLAEECAYGGSCRRQQIAARLTAGVHEWLSVR